MVRSRVEMVAPRANRVSWDDIKDLPEGGPRMEILEGELVVSPSPNWRHQWIVGELFVALRAHVRARGLGQVALAPMDVIFDPHNVAEPDVLYIATERLDIVRDRVWGAPDLCVEVLSPSSVTRDRQAKRAVYARFGVREYWIVDPDARVAEVYAGTDLPLTATYAVAERLRSPLLPDLDLPLVSIFDP